MKYNHNEEIWRTKSHKWQFFVVSLDEEKLPNFQWFDFGTSIVSNSLLCIFDFCTNFLIELGRANYFCKSLCLQREKENWEGGEFLGKIFSWWRLGGFCGIWSSKKFWENFVSWIVKCDSGWIVKCDSDVFTFSDQNWCFS